MISPRLIHRVEEFMDETGEVEMMRESFVLYSDRGSVEAWRRPFSVATMGGIEIHSSFPMYEGQEPRGGSCELAGPLGVCYHDGSGLAFDSIKDFFDFPFAMREELMTWFEARFESEAVA